MFTLHPLGPPRHANLLVFNLLLHGLIALFAKVRVRRDASWLMNLLVRPVLQKEFLAAFAVYCVGEEMLADKQVSLETVFDPWCVPQVATGAFHSDWEISLGGLFHRLGDLNIGVQGIETWQLKLDHFAVGIGLSSHELPSLKLLENFFIAFSAMYHGLKRQIVWKLRL
jgi:hypothetical protein